MQERQTDLQSVQDMLARIHEVGAAPAPGMPLNETAGFGWDGKIEIEPLGGGGGATFLFCRANGDVGFTFRVVPDAGPVPIGDFDGEFVGYIDGEAPSTANEAFKIAQRLGRVPGWRSQPIREGAEHSDSRVQAYIDGHTVGVHGLDSNCMWIQGSEEEKIWEMGTAHGAAQMFAKTADERLNAARSSGKAAREIGVPAAANPHAAARKNPEHEALASAWAGTMNESAGANPFSGFDPAVAHYIGLLDDSHSVSKMESVLSKMKIQSDDALDRAIRAVRARDASAKHGEDSPGNNRMTYGDEARKNMEEFIQLGTHLAFQCRQFLKLWEEKK